VRYTTAGVCTRHRPRHSRDRRRSVADAL